MENCNIGEFFNDLAKKWVDLSENDKKEIANKLVGIRKTPKLESIIENNADIIKIKLQAEIENIAEIENQIKDLQDKLGNMKVVLRVLDGGKVVGNDSVATANETYFSEGGIVRSKLPRTIEGIIERQVNLAKEEIEMHNMRFDGRHNDYGNYKKLMDDFRVFFNLLVNVHGYNIPSKLCEDVKLFVDTQAVEVYQLLRKANNSITSDNLTQSLIYLVNIKETLNRTSNYM